MNTSRERVEAASDSYSAYPKMDLWVGMECTQNRVGDLYFDQLDRTGHSARISDLDLLARLGPTAIRQPVLWERVCPQSMQSFDWKWTDERLHRLRELRLIPIVGLLHHGSGPPFTSLIDPDFPQKFAEYAAAVAARYPWVRHYTPVNEPLTTARFSGLYGHWYPHGQDDRTFIRCLMNQCRATALAFRRIREITPEAILVQTEDLGFTHSSPLLQYQAHFENDRRWLSLDLLFGRVDPEHPLWTYLIGKGGVRENELHDFLEEPCPPDVLGFNYYLTSERFLHEKLFLYPSSLHGGNGRDAYVDIEAVRARTDGTRGPAELLMDAWRRYRRPLAITECHNGCTREEQLRWIKHVWTGCRDAQRCGADVRAFTLWAAFGSFDWDSLVTRNRGHYEPGVFDVRSREPRCTAIGKWIKSIMRCEAEHPLLETEGWWNRPERLQHAFSVLDSGKVIPRVCHQHVYASLAAPIVLISGDSSIGHAFARVCQSRRIQFVTASDDDREFSANDQLVDAIKTSRPWAVIDTRMYEGTAPEIKGDESIRNCTDSLIAAGLCEKIGIPFVSLCPALKSDRGTQTGYTESDDGNAVPIEAFNTTSVEERLSKANPSALIVRTASLFSPWDLTNFLTAALRRLSNGEPVTARSDSVISPTYVPDVVNVTLDLLIDDEQGIWHLSNKGAATPFDFIKTTACRRGVSTDSLVPVRGRTRAGLREDARSSKEQIHLMPNLDDAIERFVNECECLPQSLTCTSVD